VILSSQVIRGVTIQVWPRIFGLPIDIVDVSQMQKCALKYVMFSPTRKVGEFVLNLDTPSLPGFGDLR
jgi:hypothetical protein